MAPWAVAMSAVPSVLFPLTTNTRPTLSGGISTSTLPMDAASFQAGMTSATVSGPIVWMIGGGRAAAHYDPYAGALGVEAPFIRLRIGSEPSPPGAGPYGSLCDMDYLDGRLVLTADDLIDYLRYE